MFLASIRKQVLPRLGAGFTMQLQRESMSFLRNSVMSVPRRMMSKKSRSKPAQRTIYSSDAISIAEDIKAANATARTTNLEIGDYTLYKSKYPHLFKAVFLFTCLVLGSHYSMIPELVRNNTFMLGTEGWTVVAGVESLILLFSLHMYASRFISRIRCSVLQKGALPESMTLITSNLYGKEVVKHVPTSHILGLTTNSKATGRKDSILHLSMMGAGQNMFFFKNGEYMNCDILRHLLQVDPKDLDIPTLQVEVEQQALSAESDDSTNKQ